MLQKATGPPGPLWPPTVPPPPPQPCPQPSARRCAAACMPLARSWKPAAASTASRRQLPRACKAGCSLRRRMCDGLMESAGRCARRLRRHTRPTRGRVRACASVAAGAHCRLAGRRRCRMALNPTHRFRLLSRKPVPGGTLSRLRRSWQRRGLSCKSWAVTLARRRACAGAPTLACARRRHSWRRRSSAKASCASTARWGDERVGGVGASAWMARCCLSASPNEPRLLCPPAPFPACLPAYQLLRDRLAAAEEERSDLLGIQRELEAQLAAGAAPHRSAGQPCSERWLPRLPAEWLAGVHVGGDSAPRPCLYMQGGSGAAGGGSSSTSDGAAAQA